MDKHEDNSELINKNKIENGDFCPFGKTFVGFSPVSGKVNVLIRVGSTVCVKCEHWCGRIDNYVICKNIGDRV